MILKRGTRKVREPDSQRHQPTPAITGLFLLETRHVPPKALCAKRDARLDGPAMTVGLPDDSSGDLQMPGNARWGLPVRPNGLGRLGTLKMTAGTNDIK